MSYASDDVANLPARRILRGQDPERQRSLLTCPSSSRRQFEFVINLKTAKQIGVTIPPEVLARANRLIKLIEFWICDFGFWIGLRESNT